MAQVLPDIDEKRWLLACAAPAEARAVLRGLGVDQGEPQVAWRLIGAHPRFDVVVAGVGKANAAAGVARVLDPARHGGVLSLGVGGALPKSKLKLGQSVLASRSVYADEGVQAPDAFVDMARLKFGPGQGIEHADTRMDVAASSAVLTALTPLVDRVAPVATVSTCSGGNRLGLTVVERTGAAVEAMEGAAVGFAALRIAQEAGAPILFGEVRTVSNTTGNRARQRWDLAGALEALARLVRGAAQ